MEKSMILKNSFIFKILNPELYEWTRTKTQRNDLISAFIMVLENFGWTVRCSSNSLQTCKKHRTLSLRERIGWTGELESFILNIRIVISEESKSWLVKSVAHISECIQICIRILVWIRLRPVKNCNSSKCVVTVSSWCVLAAAEGILKR